LNIRVGLPNLDMMMDQCILFLVMNLNQSSYVKLLKGKRSLKKTYIKPKQENLYQEHFLLGVHKQVTGSMLPL